MKQVYYIFKFKNECNILIVNIFNKPSSLLQVFFFFKELMDKG